MTDQEMAVLEKIHKVQFSLLSEFDRVCRKYDIPYYLAAGTLLGAVRHKDFIPWDDDVDVYLKRKDYNIFLQHRDEFVAPYELDVPSENDTYFWDYATRLAYKKSRIKFDEKENEFYHHTNNEHLFLDIFVLDKAHNGIRNTIQLIQLKMIYGMAMSRRYTIDYSEYASFASKLQVFILSHLGKLFSMKKLYRMYQNVSMKYDSDNSADFEQPTNITVKFLGKLFYKKAWHTKTTELEIRGKNFLGPEPYKEILTSVYGDYMSLPPENARIPEHVNELDQIEIEL